MRPRTFLAALAGMIGTVGLVAPTAAQATTPSPAPAKATITIVHGIPGAGGFPVDIYANGSKILSKIPFGWVITFKAAPGTYDLAIRGAGADPTSPAVLGGKVDFPAGTHKSVVANLTADGKPTVSVFTNDTSPVPAGKARVTVRHLAWAPEVDVVANGSLRVVQGAANGAEAVIEVPAARYELKLTPPGQDDGVYYTAYRFKEGVNTVMYAIGDIKGRFTVVPQQIKTDVAMPAPLATAAA
jgi:hypothetical protein